MNDTLNKLTPATLYLRHWDEILGDDLHRYQTINFTAENTVMIKKFMSRVKELSVRIGIAFDSHDRGTGKYYLMIFDTADNEIYEEEFSWPDLPKEAP